MECIGNGVLIETVKGKQELKVMSDTNIHCPIALMEPRVQHTGLTFKAEKIIDKWTLRSKLQDKNSKWFTLTKQLYPDSKCLSVGTECLGFVTKSMIWVLSQSR